MKYHNIKLAVRNIWKNKTVSFINIFGLVVGMSSCVLIGLYAWYEFSFDRFHNNYENIYRINKQVSDKDKAREQHAITPGQLVPAIRQNIPEVQYATLFRPWFTEMLVSNDTVRLLLNDVAYADQDFLKVFDFPLISGNKNLVLQEPFTGVITESTAKKLFNTENPIGKTVTTLNNIDVRITGVCKDVPGNSSVKFNMLISWATTTASAHADYFSWMNNWLTQVDYSFVALKPGAVISNTERQIKKVLHTNLPERAAEYTPYLQPLSALHLYSGDILFSEHFAGNNYRIIYILLLVAVVILVIACFNFINLGTAGAINRAKESGIQKVLGASQPQLVWKFLSEAVVLCLLAVFISLLLVAVCITPFNNLADTSLQVSFLLKPSILLALIGLTITVSILAGLYPAIFLAQFNSAEVFRNVKQGGRLTWLRKALVILQFTLSIVLITGTLVVQKQTRFMMTKDLGFDKEQLVVVRLANTSLEKHAVEFANSLKNFNGISNVSMSNRVPGQTFNGHNIVPEGHTEDEHLMANILETDTEFDNTYNIRLVAGRYFAPETTTDSTDAVIINQTMADYLNWREPIGKKFEVGRRKNARVIGVIHDINTTSLKESVSPLAIILKNNPLYLSVKIKPGEIKAAISHIEQQWKKMEPAYPFDYFFLDEQLNQFYKTDNRLLTVLTIFSAIAIIIACLGLFGLSIYKAQQKVKEIGIRKVLGASVQSVIALLSKEFMALILIALMIAIPIAWWFINSWLDNYAYRTPVQWWLFALSGIGAIAIALFTVSFQAIKAAIANPVKSLRTE